MQAYVLRIAPSDIDRVPEALSADQIIIGWANADGLLNEDLNWEEFREIVRAEYCSSDATLHRAGSAAGHMWRFLREMEAGDLVVVPYGPEFYVAQVTGKALFVREKQAEDSAYRRPVTWLNGKKPIPRSYAKAALISRMKIQGTSASATDLLVDIQECIALSESGAVLTFHGDLQRLLVKEALNELRAGRLDSFGFEKLIKNLLLNLGATEASVIPRSQDKGADLIATFLVAETFPVVVAVQAKHWQPDPPVGAEVVTQLVSGIEAERADLGMIITSGSFSEEAVNAAETYFERSGKKIELVDGEQFAKMIVEHGTGES